MSMVELLEPYYKTIEPRNLLDPGFQIRSGQLVDVTPARADQLIASHQHPLQRKYKDFHIDDLAKLMVRGDWINGTQLMFARLPSGVLQLVNSHHTLRAVSRSGVTVSFYVLVLDVNNQSQADLKYRLLDRVLLKRTSRDVVAAEGITASHGIGKEIARSLLEAVRYIGSDFSKKRGAANNVRLDSERLDVAEEYYVATRLFQEAIDASPHGLKGSLKVPSVVAVAVATIRHQPMLGYEFWKGVASGECGIRDARGALYRAILGNTKRDCISIMRMCATAWNAYYAGREISVLRRHDRPIIIEGTPWDGGEKDPRLQDAEA